MKLLLFAAALTLLGAGCSEDYLPNEEIARQGKICLDAGMNMAQVTTNGRIICTPSVRK